MKDDEDYFSTRECWDADPLVRGTGGGSGVEMVAIVIMIVCGLYLLIS